MPEKLVRATHEAVQRGASIVTFEGIESAPLAAKDWLRMAVRYARRE
jgi:hypothetical protein